MQCVIHKSIQISAEVAAFASLMFIAAVELLVSVTAAVICCRVTCCRNASWQYFHAFTTYIFNKYSFNLSGFLSSFQEEGKVCKGVHAGPGPRATTAPDRHRIEFCGGGGKFTLNICYSKPTLLASCVFQYRKPHLRGHPFTKTVSTLLCSGRRGEV